MSKEEMIVALNAMLEQGNQLSSQRLRTNHLLVSRQEVIYSNYEAFYTLYYNCRFIRNYRLTI